MVNSCFFCQNLLSEYRENLLTSLRRKEIADHLETCKECSAVHSSLEKMEAWVASLPQRTISHELALRMVEASEGGGRQRSLVRSRWAIGTFATAALVVVLLGGVFLFRPELLNRLPLMGAVAPQAEFVRYYPLSQGAEGVLNAQAQWVETRDTSIGSLWEDGGASPERFERSFGFAPPSENP